MAPLRPGRFCHQLQLSRWLTGGGVWMVFLSEEGACSAAPLRCPQAGPHRAGTRAEPEPGQPAWRGRRRVSCSAGDTAGHRRLVVSDQRSHAGRSWAARS